MKSTDCLFISLLLFQLSSTIQISDSESWIDKFVSSDLIPAGELKLTDPNYIHLGIIIANVGVSNLVPGIMVVFKNMLSSLFSSSKGSPLHLIMITDQLSKDRVETAIRQAVGKHLSETVIYTGKWDEEEFRLTFPRLYVEFVDMESITQPNRAEIDIMKPLFSYNIKEGKRVELDNVVAIISPKYSHDLFYMGPFYSRAFSSLNRLMVFDVDLIIKTDLAILNSVFDDMKGEEIIGVTLDQGGYYVTTQEFITKKMNISMTLEDERLKQGLNTGVVLYNLERIRQSEVFQEQIKPESFDKIIKSYGLVHMVVGDQEWFTLMMWTYPELFKVIPCEYNVQTKPLNLETSYPCPADPKILHPHGKIHDDPNKQEE